MFCQPAPRHWFSSQGNVDFHHRLGDCHCHCNATQLRNLPRNGTDSSQVDELSSQLGSFAVDADSVEEVRVKYNAVLYWRLLLSLTAAKEVEALSEIGTMWLSCRNTCAEDDPTSMHQPLL